MKRYTAFLLALTLLLSGCTIRGYNNVPSPAAEAPSPAPVSAGPTPEPEPEPTPCPHLHWEEGVCADCGEVCAHEVWEARSCTRCAAVCSHPAHDAESCLCSVCGSFCRHTYFDGICSRCGGKPEFSELEIPEALRQKCEHAGTVEHVQYETQEYFGVAPGVELKYNKRMSVYLPYGYDESRQYDVIVILHGMNCLETYWLDDEQFYDHEDTRIYTRDVLDNMIDRGLIPPVIVCSPTFYKDQVVDLGYVNAALFATELRNDILPFILEHYATYAAEPTLEAAAAAREHFGYVGLSMGSIIGFQSALSLSLDVFSYFGLFSGFSTYPANILQNIDKDEFRDLPIHYLFNAVGQWDVAYYEHSGYYRELLSKTDRLEEGRNAALVTVKEYGHEFRTWIVGLYDALQVFFSYTDGTPPDIGTAP
ncbi:MAG: hypothetical protein KBS46_00970 [Clostridiales bacterium]|nr:hypothetical protein [Candidatus Apopatocola equi]